MNTCYLCQTEAVAITLDVGMQPIGNRFLANPTDEETLYPMVIGQCEACGLVQMIDPVSADELLPPYDWITYNEPEGHLDQMVDIIAGLPGVIRDATICGISFKDDSTLARFEKLGFKQTWRIHPKDDLSINNPGAGVETIQAYLTPEAAIRMVEKYGQSDIVIVRHILEHAHGPFTFMAALKQLVKPEGYIVFEVPDCMRALENCDYTTLWEEHTLYFTPETFKSGLAFGGFSLICFESYPYPFENSLVGIVQPQSKVTSAFPTKSILEDELHRAQTYAETLRRQRTKLKKFFSEYQGKIALFGAGHLACTYICVLGLQDYIEFIVDDNPNKRGLYMPGSHLPIYGSDALVKEDVKLCLLSLNPLSEDKVIQKNQEFMENGGVFFSIFPASKHALRI